jgi:hypothetical protein
MKGKNKTQLKLYWKFLSYKCFAYAKYSHIEYIQNLSSNGNQNILNLKIVSLFKMAK